MEEGDLTATRDLHAVHKEGAIALCPCMYTEHGLVAPTMCHGGPSVNSCETTSALWRRLKPARVGARGGRVSALVGWPRSVNAAEMGEVWCSLVRALPLVDEWALWTGGTQYPTGATGHFYGGTEVVRMCTASSDRWAQTTFR